MSTTEVLIGSTQQQAPVEKQEERKSETRNYVVLESVQDGTWRVVKTIEAANVEGALRSLGEGQLKESAKYVAVPERSWNPVTPKVKKTTTISFD